MKFQDFFLPKISRSDPEVRKKAVREAIDVELLKQVIKKDAKIQSTKFGQRAPAHASTRTRDRLKRSLNRKHEPTFVFDLNWPPASGRLRRC